MRKPTRVTAVVLVAAALVAAGWIWLASRAPDRAEPVRVEVARLMLGPQSIGTARRDAPGAPATLFG